MREVSERSKGMSTTVDIPLDIPLVGRYCPLTNRSFMLTYPSR